MNVISVIVGSIRQGRFSEKPAQWIFQHLKKRDVDSRVAFMAMKFGDESALRSWLEYQMSESEEVKPSIPKRGISVEELAQSKTLGEAERTHDLTEVRAGRRPREWRGGVLYADGSLRSRSPDSCARFNGARFSSRARTHAPIRVRDHSILKPSAGLGLGPRGLVGS